MASIVAISRQADYSHAGVLNALRQCMAHLGGMRAFVKPGQRVLLKPNLLSGVPPERAVTTHPTVVAAAIMLVREAGGLPFIAESPGIGGLASIARKAGIEDVMRSLSVPYGVCNEETVFSCDANTVVKRLPLLKAVADADVIISLPKLKTHAQMTFTGAIKNQFGLVLGIAKGQYHFRFQDRLRLGEFMLDINRMVKPALAIMDAVIGMEGDGPAGGDPRPIGALIASADLMALDVVACHVIGLDPATVPTVKAGILRGYGATSLDAIEIAGSSLDETRVRDFRLVPGSVDLLGVVPLPRFLLRWFGRQWVPRPRIIADKCTTCMACRDGCPVRPTAIDPGLPVHQQVNDRTCIRCYCCHEFCPSKAIRLKRSVLDRLFRFTPAFNWLMRKL